MKIKPSSKTIQGFIVATLMLSVALLVYNVCYTYHIMKEEERVEQQIDDYYDICDNMKNTSDFFTEEAREFAIDYDINRLVAYWKEADETHTIEKCVGEISNGNFTDAELSSVYDMQKELITLRKTDATAMLLVASACKYDTSVLPDGLKEYKLTVQQRIMSDEEKLYEARIMLYGENYSASKEIIDYNISNFRDTVDVMNEHNRENAKELLDIAFVMQICGLCMLTVIVSALLIMYKVLCVAPLVANAKKADVSGSIPLEEKGLDELVVIAKRYNEKIISGKEE